MTRKSWEAIALLMSLVFSPGLLDRADAQSIICRQLAGYEYCPDCPGFQWCDCLYQGAPCLDDIGCYRRQTAVNGNRAHWTEQTYCYWSRGCASLHGGPCDPLLNPCVKDDAMGLHGQMDILIDLGGWCVP